MFTTIKGILKGDRIILEENIPFLEEQSVLITLLNKSTTAEKDLVLTCIQAGI
jgi:hypothetical protein